MAAVSPMLPAGLEAVTGATLTAEDDADIAADFLDFFEVFLLVFAGVALLVATFTIHNTLSIVVAQRTRESALLRALGASRRQVLTAVVIESLIVGVVASGIGLVAGLGLANGLERPARRARLRDPDRRRSRSTRRTVIASFVVGIAVTLVASLTPAIKASRVAPLAALRDVDVDRSGSSIVRAVIGGLVTAAGVALVIVAPETPDAAMAAWASESLLTLVGFVMVGPVVARWAAGVIGAPIAIAGGQTGKLARRNAMRNPRRTAGTASALMLGTAVVALFATFGASIKRSLDELIADAYEGDLVIVQDGWGGVGLSPELARRDRRPARGRRRRPVSPSPPSRSTARPTRSRSRSIRRWSTTSSTSKSSPARSTRWTPVDRPSVSPYRRRQGLDSSAAWSRRLRRRSRRLDAPSQAVFEDANILGDLLIARGRLARRTRPAPTTSS